MRWDYFERGLQALQAVAVVFGIIFALYQWQFNASNIYIEKYNRTKQLIEDERKNYLEAAFSYVESMGGQYFYGIADNDLKVVHVTTKRVAEDYTLLELYVNYLQDLQDCVDRDICLREVVERGICSKVESLVTSINDGITKGDSAIRSYIRIDALNKFDTLYTVAGVLCNIDSTVTSTVPDGVSFEPADVLHKKCRMHLENLGGMNSSLAQFDDLELVSCSVRTTN